MNDEAIFRAGSHGLPSFPRRFRTLAVEAGRRMMFEEREDGICLMVDDERVAEAILDYVTHEVPDAAYRWTANQARDCADFWRMLTPPAPRPAPLLWADEPGATFHRLPWRSDDAGGATPLWDELMGRMSNAAAFRSWVGSLFDAGADLQQYVWLYGQGQNGKGAITRFLEKAFGPSFSSQQPPTKDDKFWTYSLRDKRLVVFPDCNNVTFVTTGLFKSLTGGDAIRIEGKGKDAVTARFSCKFLFSSNGRPALSSEMADMRRVIFCELGAIAGDPNPTYEERLSGEGGAFLRRCVDEYRAACPTSGRILDVEMDEAHAISAETEEAFEVAFAESFAYHPAKDGEAQAARPHVTPAEMRAVVGRHFGASAKDESGFRDWMKRHFGVFRQKVKLPSGRTEWRYVGLSKK